MKAGNNSSAKRIQKELAEISLDPPCNCSAGPKGDNIYEWVSTIMGPSGERGVATLMRAESRPMVCIRAIMLPMLLKAQLDVAYAADPHCFCRQSTEPAPRHAPEGALRPTQRRTGLQPCRSDAFPDGCQRECRFAIPRRRVLPGHPLPSRLPLQTAEGTEHWVQQ